MSVCVCVHERTVETTAVNSYCPERVFLQKFSDIVLSSLPGMKKKEKRKKDFIYARGGEEVVLLQKRFVYKIMWIGLVSIVLQNFIDSFSETVLE